MHTGVLHSTTATDTERDDPVAGLRRRLMRQADTCVACGMCLPVCPTYTDTRDEAESARGRISLIRGLAEGRLTPSAQVVGHLDHCLQCQACEAICPAGVRYGELIDGAHELLHAVPASAPTPRLARSLAWLVRTRWRLSLFGRLLALYRISGLQWLARRSGFVRALGLEQAEGFARVRTFRYDWRRSYPAQGEERGGVALFTGCVANLVDRDNLQAAIRVLQRSGYRVEVPPEQGCCGAIDLHAGCQTQFETARARNVEAFSHLQVQAVLYLASGCGAVLNGYQQAAGTANGRGIRFMDVDRFLVEVAGLEPVAHQRAAENKVFLHIPCSMKHVNREQDAPKRLLERLGLTFSSSPAAAHCCGAAGTYSLRYPELAKRLGRNVLQQAKEGGCSTIATCNVGCALHLQALAQQDGLAIEVTHPVRLAEQHLRPGEHAQP